jgi:peptidoglycan-associated lipoprotein
MQRLIIAAIVVAAALSGCTSTPTTAPVEDKSAAAAPGTSGASTSGASTSGVSGSPTGATNPLKDPKNILSKRSIYFEFDSFVVVEQFKPMVEAHAKYLAANRSAKVTLQGHTDERGSREYNIALGQKRADAVKRMLTLMGVQEVQVESVSFGKEKPRREGHDEASWAENRRVDIVYVGE